MEIARKKKPITPQSPHKTRVFIVDDHPVVRQGYTHRINLEPDMEVCGDAATAHDAMRQIDTLYPDVAMIDLSLGEGNGLDLIKDLKSRGDRVKVLVVSSQEESVYAERCVRVGARGYLNKSESIDKIVDAIRRVDGDGYYLSDTITKLALKRAVSGENELNDSPIDSLSDRELQVYQLIGQGLTVSQIAEQLFLSPKTIETYRVHLKRKLGIKSSNELTRHAIQRAMGHS